MTKQELVKTVADNTGMQHKEVGAVLQELINVVAGAFAKGEKLEIRGFGTFKPKYYKARVGNDIRNKVPVQIPARKVMTFKMSPRFKDLAFSEEVKNSEE